MKKIVKTLKWIAVVLLIGGLLVGGYFLGAWYYEEYYIPKKYDKLIEKGLNDSSIADSMALVLISKTYGHYRAWNNYQTKVLELLRESAEKGNTRSQVLLGRYYKGYGFEECSIENSWRNSWFHAEKSSYWFLQAAKTGNVEAQGELGHNYLLGFGVKQDFNKAVYWLKCGADNGNAIAQLRLGNVYENGLAYYRGYFTDYQTWWYYGDNTFIAQNNGSVVLAKKYVAEMMNRGPYEVFLSPDINKAKYYWRLSADQGCSQAKSKLERIYSGDDNLLFE